MLISLCLGTIGSHGCRAALLLLGMSPAPADALELCFTERLKLLSDSRDCHYRPTGRKSRPLITLSIFLKFGVCNVYRYVLFDLQGCRKRTSP